MSKEYEEKRGPRGADDHVGKRFPRERKSEERVPVRERDAEADGLIEGRNAVTEALRAGTPIDKIFIARGETDKTLGHIASTARAAGVVVAKARSASVGVGAYKTSAGAVMHIPIAQVPNLARAVEELQRAGFWACAATEHAEQDVWHAPMGGRLALVMGPEGEGISRLVAEKCDFACRLPQRGRVESLNVAQATTVLCYEWLRRVETAGDAGTGADA